VYVHVEVPREEGVAEAGEIAGQWTQQVGLRDLPMEQAVGVDGWVEGAKEEGHHRPGDTGCAQVDVRRRDIFDVTHLHGKAKRILLLVEEKHGPAACIGLYWGDLLIAGEMSPEGMPTASQSHCRKRQRGHNAQGQHPPNGVVAAV
jgi:hypothetical protein